MSKYNETKIFYRIYDKENREYVHANVGAGTNRTQTEFGSIKEARGFNCHGLFKDKTKYEIHEFKSEISSDCVDVDPMTVQDKKEREKRKQANEIFQVLFSAFYRE